MKSKRRIPKSVRYWKKQGYDYKEEVKKEDGNT